MNGLFHLPNTYYILNLSHTIPPLFPLFPHGPFADACGVARYYTTGGYQDRPYDIRSRAKRSFPTVPILHPTGSTGAKRKYVYGRGGPGGRPWVPPCWWPPGEGPGDHQAARPKTPPRGRGPPPVELNTNCSFVARVVVFRVYSLMASPISAQPVVFCGPSHLSLHVSLSRRKKALATKGGKEYGSLHGSSCLHR
jgi:hypothetical protein